MKIKFLIGDFSPDYEIDRYHKEISDSKYRNDPLLDINFYNSIKALELNKEFEKQVKKARKKLGIPFSGYSTLQEYIKNKFPWKIKMPVKKDNTKITLNIVRAKYDIIKTVSSKFDLSENISEQLDHIIFGSCVIVPPKEIIHGLYALSEDSELDEDYWCFQISILSPVTKNKLISHIERNWSSISKQMSKLKKKKTVKISKRDLRIVELRDDEKHNYNKIADKIVAEFKLANRNATVNQDSVKTAYRRAKQKIASFQKGT